MTTPKQNTAWPRKSLSLTSCLSEVAEPFCLALAGYLAERLDTPCEFVREGTWQERLLWLERGEIDLGWVCGAVYVQRPQVELLCAPVMAGARYQGRPVYFSDVMVRWDSRYHALADLRGARWAFNEPESFSGYLLPAHHLARYGMLADLSERGMGSGSHTRSVQWILEGRAEVAAIDSTVFDLMRKADSGVGAALRAVDCLGPYPIPPWVASRAVQDGAWQALRKVFMQIHKEPRGQEVLKTGLVARFVEVQAGDYDPIRKVARLDPA